jgi:hypothetical protein
MSKQKFPKLDHLSKQSTENNARKQKGLPSARVCHPLHQCMASFFFQNRGKIKQQCAPTGVEKQMRFLSTGRASQLGRKIEREREGICTGKKRGKARETKFFSADKLVFAFLICLPWSQTPSSYVHSSFVCSVEGGVTCWLQQVHGVQNTHRNRKK